MPGPVGGRLGRFICWAFALGSRCVGALLPCRPTPAAGAGLASVAMGEVQAVAATIPSSGSLTSLDSLPWESMTEPPSGYQDRTVVECAGRPAEMLLDTGAAFSFVFEEVIVAILNQAVADGLTSESPEWPLAGLYQWGV